MKKFKTYFILILVFIMVLATVSLAGCKSSVKKPVTSKRSLNVVGFYVDSPGYDNSYNSLVKYAKYMNTLSPLWLTV
ncbi:hypothetical protein Q2T46_04260 [Thermoanaerobacterium sp. CMT5567-10]|uniref:hypothetical protein n=1 Tax=Thermoanaerobacterium sp. CMT5567-10 TaxID=3061989 RepID=UPI0026E0978E|nr:hypothetical protein [Thermoanaerobacterium sp. CMT5567-10]WKV09667.1 hypothetical protein Q2T46_04260 [Thermoanaerobacterium sp. CMT5567-10]